ASFVNEIVAISRAISRHYPEVKSVIDIGGEDSKFILLENGRIKDFSMNALCAAGTGSFLDQQASRLRFTIEEFGEIALRAKHIPRIAGRCTVFAKSDMIHLQQIATPDYEIVAGLCYALARNFKGNIVKGKELKPPCVFIGGVAANVGMRQALRDVFSLGDREFFVPEHFTSMGALGAIYKVLEDPSIKKDFAGLERLDLFLKEDKPTPSNEPLEISQANLNVSYELKPIDRRKKFYLGVDVGSISTNLALIDEDKNVVAKRYLMTEGRPLEAVKRGLREIWEEVGEVEIAGCGTTGSGRYLTADFIGADIVRNEITAQAEAAINIDPEVDTIFEIGGQDSKFISIDNGVIVDFEMNKSCAAGTGSFLEEQAERLGISIKEEFAALALSSRKPVKLGERCTVFIESDVLHHQQRGSEVKDIAAGLAYSIVLNYLNKVVGDKRIGKRIFFQGGTAFNKAVIAAFEKVLQRPITVPPHHDVTGAIGVAILAMKEKNWEKSRFKGFDLSERKYEIETFECKGCENLCEIRKVTVENEAPLYYGSRCDKYDVIRRSEKKELPDLFRFRSELLTGIYEGKEGGEPIGIPRILYMHEFLPFFKAFLSELGFSVVLSDATNKKTIKDGVETIIVESCFPVKVAHGHVLNLLQKGLRRLFIPSIINIKSQYKYAPNAFACPYTQSIPYTSKASIDFERMGAIVDTPIIYFGFGEDVLLQNLLRYGRTIGRSTKEIKRAVDVALSVQEEFWRRLKEKGTRFLAEIKGENVMVLVGRPYNSMDPGANLNIHRKLMDLGVKSIPMDMLPLPFVEEESAHLEHMYWGYGQKILNAAKFIAEHKGFYAIYVSNFGCGPDSFITHFFKRIMGKKPYLQLEIDEHSADAGIVTRLEAFLDSIKNAKDVAEVVDKRAIYTLVDGKKRTVLIPYMSDHA
ncbi:MAG: acyl-CoA dehydratase activase, partial [Candidatus Bathyarchaeia archaeon]